MKWRQGETHFRLLVLLGKGDVGIWIVLLSIYVLSGEIL